MAKTGETYGITSATPHAQQTSTGTADVKTLAPPAGAVACMLTVTTNPARITLDGTTPTASNGLLVPTGAMPLPLSVARTMKFVSSIAANSIVDVLWLN